MVERAQRRARRFLTLAAGLGLAFLPALAGGDEPVTKRVRPTWTRPAGARAEVTRPAPGELPIELRAERPSAAARREAKPAAEIERQAVAAGAHVALEALRVAGRIEYYRAGLWRGMRTAFADAYLGRWDHLEGLRLGALDPQARALGATDGARMAEDTATSAADERVAEQFANLEREPRFDPYPGVPDYRGVEAWAAEAELREVFDEYPAARWPEAGPRLAEAFAGWRYDPWDVQRSTDDEPAFDRTWSNADRAFDAWRADRHASRYFRELKSEAERARFRAAFATAFRDEIGRQVPLSLERAWRAGFEDGWDYGAYVAREWSFRRGYAEGFDSAARAAAEGAYRATYPRAFERGYEVAFESWSRAVHPEILAVRLADGDDDGIFEPGERIHLECDVANLGGGAGALRLDADGEDLAAPEQVAVRFDGRGRTSAPVVLALDLRADARLEAHAEVRLSLGEARRDVELRVSRPVGFAGRAVARVMPLEGAARIEFTIVNRSRKPQTASVTLDTVAGRPDAASLDLGTLEPGERRPAAFDLDGLPALDLIEGTLEVTLSVRRGTESLERLTHRLPNLTADPAERDLVHYFVELARRASPPPAEVARAHALLLRQVRAEWIAAASGSGNPYRDDLRHRAGSTLLGELASTWAAEGEALRTPELLSRLGEDLESSVAELPGFHPRLRKAARDLARRIG